MRFTVFVVSHARAQNVSAIQSLADGHKCNWLVGKGEEQAYLDAGAHSVVESGALCRSRNAAMELCHPHSYCVQLSDDLTKIETAVVGEGGKVVSAPATFSAAVEMVIQGMQSTGAQLGGSAPTSNPFYANVEKPIHPSAFVVGDFMVTAPGCSIRFDERFTLKEDYDYTLQHISKVGMVARRDDVLMSFLHRSNAGGAVAVRTAELEQENMRLLFSKWPGFVKMNPRRQNEVLLNLPRRK